MCGERIWKSSSQVTTGHSPPKCFCTASSIPVACKRYSALEMGASAVNQLALGKSIWPQSPTTPRTSGWLEAFCWQDAPEMRPLRAQPNHSRRAHPPGHHSVRPSGTTSMSLADPSRCWSSTTGAYGDAAKPQGRCADKQPRENHPTRLGAKAEHRVPPTSRPCSGTICPRSGSLVARCENSTGGTTLRLPHSLRLPRGTQRILTGSRGVVVPIFATFEGYGRPKPWCEALADSDSFLNRETPCLPAAPPTLADEQSPQRQRRHPPRPNGRRHTTTILSNI